MTPSEFIAAIAPAAVESARGTGIPASFTIAEGALESGWGAHCPGNNLFGVKADSSWEGAVTVQRTREVFNGQAEVITARFRAYPDWQGCMDDHAYFLRVNPRYARAFNHTDDGEEFARQIAAAGYATDPDYAKKIISIIRSHNLLRFDTHEEDQQCQQS